ncbi:uncharacterized protein VTP21DRAFT_5716 [Calcarisporiella thermophila]|uniref:uncharacterized protein n=1 Tax=Calcarisporiella thermophila TaxID=911321 RepID=UPI003741F4E5
MSARAAASHIDWSKLTVSLGLKRDTIASLQAFRKRNEEARRVLAELKAQKTDVDFAKYRELLKNKQVVEEAEKQLKSFKPTTYDVQSQIKAIEKFEAVAIERAKQTASKVETELADLQKTLTNIETARPIDELTVDDVLVAEPRITETVEKMVQKGKWNVPGYKEKFGDMAMF